MLITNYSIFSVLLNQKTNSYSRWFPGKNNSAFPIKGDKFYNTYQKFIISIILNKNIESIYILSDVREYSLLDYVDLKCLNKNILKNNILRFDIKKNCLQS